MKGRWRVKVDEIVGYIVVRVCGDWKREGRVGIGGRWRDKRRVKRKGI